MVNGIESFREKFRNYADCYTVIGGAACDILMTEADFNFRATKDIDMIVLLEDRYQTFARIFWEYIKEGGYTCGWKNSTDVHFYRFTEPKPGYPMQIEIFSRKPAYHLDVEEGIVPIHITEDVSSLSAILLNDDYYQFMMTGRKVVDDICVLDAAYLIPFKMFAWIDLSDKKEQGKHVNRRDLNKHKYDVFRLLEIIPEDEKIVTFGAVSDNVQMFLSRIQDEVLPLAQIGLSIEKEQALDRIRSIYT